MKPIGDAWKFVIGTDQGTRAVADVLTALGHEGATLQGGRGLWQGVLEWTVTVTIAGLDQDGAERLALALADAFDQDAIYVEFRGFAFLVERETVTDTLTATVTADGGEYYLQQKVTFTKLVDGLKQMKPS